jgi:hypothetical protein
MAPTDPVKYCLKGYEEFYCDMVDLRKGIKWAAAGLKTPTLAGMERALWAASYSAGGDALDFKGS